MPTHSALTLMTPEQFEVVADLIRSREPAKSAARMILLESVRVVDAAEATGISAASASNTATRFRAAHAKILSAYAKQVKGKKGA